jgi:hypothetical protein
MKPYDDPYYQKLRNRKTIADGAVLPVVSVLLITLTVVLSMGRGCMVSEGQALSALDTSGYTDGKIVNRSNFFPAWSGCNGDDAAAFTAKAKNPQGKPVTVLVCVGWPFKGSTVRVP